MSVVQESVQWLEHPNQASEDTLWREALPVQTLLPPLLPGNPFPAPWIKIDKLKSLNTKIAHDAKDLSEYQNIIFFFGLFIIAKKLLVRNHPPVLCRYRGDQLIRTNLCSGRINRNANIQFNWNIEIIPSSISVSIDFPAPYSEKMCKHCLWFEKKNKPYEVTFYWEVRSVCC